MPIRIRYQNDSNQECTIRPTPLVSISENLLKNGAGEAYGVTYTIVLTGTILADQGTPYVHDRDGNRYATYGPLSPNEVGPYNAFDNNISHFGSNKPPKQAVSQYAASHGIFFKQQVLRALFAQDGQRLEISDIDDDEPTIVCYPRLVGDIQFERGTYVDRADFTITLEADTLLDKDLKVNDEGSLISGDNGIYSGQTEDNILSALSGVFISSYTNEWSIEVDDSVSESTISPRSYRITHNINAVGKTHYKPNGTKLKAWEQARTFVQRKLANSISDYPNVMGQIGSGTINLIDSYGGFNHTRTEQVGDSDGSYGVTETWLIASGTAYEDFTMSLSNSTSDPYVNVSIDGRIRGLTQISPSGFTASNTANSAYDNSLLKYNVITNSGQFGVGSDVYKRANNLVAVQLNSQPKSISLGTNPFNGEVTYSLQWDNRPTNIISGVISESIFINDTYPGDVISIIPVIGRPHGPILQAIGGRTEYSRDVAINLTLDYTDIPYGNTRNPLLLKKPSIVEPTATQLSALLKEVSPSGEPGVRKFFLKSAPVENWSPKEGTYSLNLSWVYELKY